MGRAHAQATPRRLRGQRAARGARLDRGRSRGAARRRSSGTTSRSSYVAQHTSTELPTGYSISAFWGGQEGSLLLWLLVLDGVLRRRPCSSTGAARPTSSRGPCRCSAACRRSSRSCSSPSRARSRRRRRRRGRGPQPEPAEPVHARAPAAALPRLRRADRAVRVRDGRAARAAHGRAVDRRDAPLDARRVDGARRRAAARLALGVRRGRLGRLLRVGSRRERGADAVARRDRVPALGDDPGEARDAEGLEHAARHPRVLPLALRHVPHALGRRQLDPLVHREPARAVVPRLHLPRHGVLARARVLAAAAAALEDAARVARLARGGVPLQQPAARRALPDDPLGRRVPDALGARARRVAHDRAAVLRLLPADVRAAAAAADGDRAAHRLAARLAALARAHVRLAGRRSPSRSGVVLVALGAGSSTPGLDRVHVLARSCSRRSCSSSCAARARRARSRSSSSRNRRRYGGYIVHAAIVLLALGIAGSSAYGSSARAEALARPVDGGRRLHAHVPLARRSSAAANHLAVRAAVDVYARRQARRARRARQEPLLRRAAGLERDGDPHRLAARRGRRRDRRPDRRRTARSTSKCSSSRS